VNGFDLKVLFIGGYGRSGSTLLDRVLGETSGVVSLGEVRHLWREGLVENRRCGCGTAFRDCPHWSGVLTDAFGPAGPDVDEIRRLQTAVDRWWRIPVLARRSEGAQLRRYADYLGALYRAVAVRTGAQVLVDSSKDVSHGWVLQHLGAGFDVRTLHLVRDARAAAYSWMRNKDDPGSGRAMNRWPAWRTALEWNAINALTGALRWTGRPYLRLRYEDLMANPAAEVDRVLAFADHSAPCPVAADRTVNLGAGHLVAGNPDRFHCGPTRISSDATWRTGLPRRDRTTVTLLSAVPLARQGYLGGAGELTPAGVSSSRTR
jgi:hypothetical protein